MSTLQALAFASCSGLFIQSLMLQFDVYIREDKCVNFDRFDSPYFEAIASQVTCQVYHGSASEPRVSEKALDRARAITPIRMVTPKKSKSTKVLKMQKSKLQKSTKI